jgi:hypothetical protein
MILIIPSITCTILNSISEGSQGQPPSVTSEEIQPAEPGEDLPEAKGDEIEITQTTTYQDEFGYWHLHGLLTNIADYPVGGFTLEVQMAESPVIEADSDGTYGIAPGAIQPFNVRLPLTVTNLDDLEIKILHIQRILINPVQMEIVQSKLTTAENGMVTLVGEVQNNTSTPALIYSARAGLFSSEGELITTAPCQICPGYVVPGDKAPVQFLIYGHPANPAVGDGEIYIAAYEAAFVDGLVFDFDEPIHTYIDPAGGFHVLGDLQNNSDKILALELTGTFYDQNGEIVGASSYTLPGYALAGERSPYELTIADPLDTIADWSIRIELARTSERRTPVYPLVKTGEETDQDQYQWTVAGNAVNESGQTLRLITVVVGLRETGTGKLVGLAQQIKAGEFPPGEPIDYSVIINPDPGFDPGVLEEFILLLGE